jgi:hypothetical protein
METSREVFENIKRFYVQELKALKQKLISRMD